MSVQTASGGTVTSTSTRNNKGTIKHGGKVAGTVFQQTSVATPGEHNASQIVDTGQVDPVISGNTFPGTVSNAAIYGTKTASAAIRITGGGDTNPIHRRESNSARLDTTAMRAGEYNSFTGVFDSNRPIEQTDAFGNDDASRPTRAVPGELTVHQGGFAGPVNKDYSAKTG